MKKCHHNIILGRINIHTALPPSYVCEVWDYSKASIKNIQKAVPIFGWKKAFENLSVDEKLNLRSETLLKIFRNYIPKENIKFSKCQTPWMNDKIKKCLKERTKFTNFYYKNGQRNEDQEKLEAKTAYCLWEIWSFIY